jgi:hypothetical protein
MYSMRKNLIITLLLAILVTFSLAADDPSASFNISTSISAINEMKITNKPVTTATFGDDDNSFSGTVAIVGNGEGANMDSSGNVTFAAYISTLSNNRSGYSVSMSATPLTSDGATINYTVTVNEVPYTTGTPSPSAVTVLTVSSLSELDAKSLPIAVTVVRSEYDSAVQGTYEGSVTFEYKAVN